MEREDLLDFSRDYILENEVVRLRPLMMDDYAHLTVYADNEPDLWEYSQISAAGKGLAGYLKTAIAGRQERQQYPFVVYDKREGKYAGSTRYYDIQAEQRALQLGYTWYGKQFQRTGLNRHCKLLMLQFAFEEMGVERVEFRADYANKRSIEAMKNIGCVEEGILRSNGVRPDGSRRDSIVLSILRIEWFDHVKTFLRSKIN